MPPHHHPHESLPHPTRHHPRHTEHWYANVEEETISRERAGEIYAMLGEELDQAGAVELDSETIAPPPVAWAVLVHEPDHRGSSVLRFELKWFEDGSLPRPLHLGRGPHRARRLFEYEGEVTVGQAVDLLRLLAEGVSGGALQLGGTSVTLPERMKSIRRYACGPRGDLIFKVVLEWWDSRGSAGARSSISDLVP